LGSSRAFHPTVCHIRLRQRFPVLENLARLYRKIDGFAIVSGEYTDGIPPALKNLLDHFLEEYFFRQSAISCYSAAQFGGVRARDAIAHDARRTRHAHIPSLLPMPRVPNAFTPAGDPTDPGFEKRHERLFRQFKWYETRCAEHAPRECLIDDFELS